MLHKGGCQALLLLLHGQEVCIANLLLFLLLSKQLLGTCHGNGGLCESVLCDGQDLLLLRQNSLRLRHLGEVLGLGGFELGQLGGDCIDLSRKLVLVLLQDVLHPLDHGVLLLAPLLARGGEAPGHHGREHCTAIGREVLRLLQSVLDSRTLR